jgi:AraC-like DNA-binding protein
MLSAEPCVGVMINDCTDRRQVLDAVAPLARVRLCPSSQDLRANIESGDLTGVVCECRDSYGLPLSAGLASGHAWRDVPTLCFLQPTAADVLFFTDLVCSGLPARGRVTGQAEIGDVVRSVVEHRWLPEAGASIIRQIVERLPAPPELVVVLAVIAGSRRIGVRAFAQLAHMSERTLQRRLADARLPTAVRLLAWATTLHSTWRLERDGDRVKQVGAASGFQSRQAFTSFIRRHTNCSASGLSRRGSFLQVLEEFIAELAGN